MSRNEMVIASPTALRWARENGHFTKEIVLEHFNQKSKQGFNLTGELISRIETTPTEIKVSLLKELSSLYEQPLAVFFLENPPEKEKKPTDERTRGNGRRNDPLSPHAMFVLRTAHRVQLAASELKEELNEPVIFKLPVYTLGSNPVSLAAEFRKSIGLTVEKQTSFSKPDGLFTWIRSEIEKTGIYVLKEPFPIGDALAFSITEEHPYVIIVNSKWGGRSYAPKIFSLLHEFAHILLRHGSICNNFTYSTGGIETFCNKFAANVLIPSGAFKSELRKITDQFNEDDLDEYISELANIFKASRPALLLRFLEQGFISKNLFDRKTREWGEDYEARNEKDIPFRVYPHTKALNSMGRSFSDLVIRAVADQKITRDAAADLLDVQPTYLSRIARRLKEKI
jgi:Zn-dependent peptidase ImmA (M78 family)